MAAQLLQQLQSSSVPTFGHVITKHGHDDGSLAGSGLRVSEASHPVPCDAGVAATRQLLAATEDICDETLVFVLLTGGGSSLFTLPAEGLTLAVRLQACCLLASCLARTTVASQDIQATSEVLLGCGADIHAMNTVRKALSGVKGGRFRRYLARARAVHTLALSDVVGDNLETIASGPTCAVPCTRAAAVDVLEAHGALSQVPPAVATILKAGAAAPEPATGSGCFVGEVIGSNAQALEAAAQAASEAGYTPHILTAALEGEARHAAAFVTSLAKAASGRSGGKIGHSVVPPAALIFGGETTVNLTDAPQGHGKGGRNQELALASALLLDGHSPREAPPDHPLAGEATITLAAVGTDGTDGPTDAAGGIVSSATFSNQTRPETARQAAGAALKGHDAYPCLAELGALHKTGPTGTNVMDITVALVLV